MLNQIIHFSIKNKLIVLLGTLSLIIYGVYSFGKLPIDAVPDITDNQVQIITPAPALAAPEIERLITFPIEQSIANIPNIKEIRSFSRFGLSLVTVVFTDATDVYWARQQISERLIQAQNQIPAGTGTPELAPVTTGLGEIFQYVVRPKPGFEKAFSPTDLRTIQDWIVRRQLLGVEGVADVSSFGGLLKQYEIAIHPDELKAKNLSIQDVFTALENNNQNTGGSYIEKEATVLFIRSEGLINNIQDIKNILVKNTPNGQPILLNDIAKVNIGAATRYGAMCIDDKGEVAGAVVMMLKGENSSKVIKLVKQRIKQIEKTLPVGVEIEPFLDRTKMVNNAIHTVEQNLLEGALIVLFVLVVFLGNLRAGLLVASVIPLSMMFAVIMMNLFGVSGNLMSLGALDFGLIIDGAVIIVEAVMHRLAHSKLFGGMSKLSPSTMDKEVGHTAGKMMSAAVFGQIIILIVYLPILSLEGIEGKMFKPMAQTVAFALLGAFILSLTYIPMMASLVLSKKVKYKPNLSDRIMYSIESIYARILNTALRFSKSVIFLSLVSLSIAIITMFSFGGEFIPKLEEGDFAVDTRVLTGSSLNTTIESTQKAARVILANFPEVLKVVTKIGSGEIPTDPMPIEAADMMVILKDKHQWTSAKSFDELAEKMSKRLEEIPGITAGFQYPVQMRFNELMTGARQDVVCKIFGENLDTLAHYAKKLGEIVEPIQGAKDVYVETVTGMPQIVVEYDRSAISRFGLNISDINRVLKTAFAGESAGLLYEGEKRFDIVVRLSGEKRKHLQDIEDLLIPTPMGTQIKMSQIAKVDIKEGINQIQREDAKRRITVGFNVRGRDVQTVVGELQKKIDTKMKLPAGYFITYGGQFENLIAAKERLGVAVPISLGLIFLILYFAFQSLTQSILIYTAIPLSAIGGIFALWLRGMPFSISAGVGFIALFGVAVLNGIVLISECNRLKYEGHTYLKGILFQATRTRLRPILMTAAVASLGFLPMALSNGAGAEVQRPLATVVIGGLFSATLLTLFVLPILYIWVEKRTAKKGLKPVVLPMLIIFYLFHSPTVQAQYANTKYISIEEAIQIGLSKNIRLKTDSLRIREKEKIVHTAKEMPKTQFNLELGQINSRAFDSKWSASQSFKHPNYYKSQANVFEAEADVERSKSAMTAQELKIAIYQAYYELLYLDYKKNIYLKYDSLYKQSVLIADKKMRLGETGILEKTNAETQEQQNKYQIQLIRKDIEYWQLILQSLLYTDEWLMPQAQTLKMPFELKPANLPIKNHILLTYLEKEIKAAQERMKAIRAETLPEFTTGYALQSIRGTQTFADKDYTYNAIPRFSVVQLGVQIPLFKENYKRKQAVVAIQEQVLQNELLREETNLTNEYRALAKEYEMALEGLNYHENIAIPQADKLLRIANISRANGEISYFEWILSVKETLEIQKAYLDTIYRYNQLIIRFKKIF